VLAARARALIPAPWCLAIALAAGAVFPVVTDWDRLRDVAAMAAVAAAGDRSSPALSRAIGGTAMLL